MFTMQTHPKAQALAFEYTRGVVGSVIACVVLLLCLVAADKLIWKDPWSAQTYYYDQHRWNTGG